MKRHTLPIFAFVVVVTLLLPAVPVTAQDPTDPLRQRMAAKAQAAGDDPAGFTAEQTSDEGLADDANWTIAYGCYVGHVATDEAGLPPPDVEACGEYEEALGIAEEERQEANETVAAAEDLEDTAQVEAEAVLEDLEATAGQVVAEPQTAPEALLAFLDRTARALGRIADAVTDFVRDTVTGLGLGLAAIGKGAVVVLAAPVAGTQWLIDGALEVATATTSGVATAILFAGHGVRDAITTATAALQAAAGGIGDAVVGAYSGLEAFVADLFGPTTDAAVPKETGSGMPEDLVPSTGDLLQPAQGLDLDLESR